MSDTESHSSAAALPVNVSLSEAAVDGLSISVKYQTPNGNNPNTYGNVLLSWSAGEVPWEGGPLLEGKASVTGGASSGRQNFELEVTGDEYLIAYAVGPVESQKSPYYYNVVATAYLPSAGSSSTKAIEYKDTTVTIDPKRIFARQLKATHEFLEGFNPKNAGAWAGIWVGKSVSYTSKPKFFAQCKSESALGEVTFDGISLLRNTTYTVGLLPTGWDKDEKNMKHTALAATATFTTAVDMADEET